MARKRQRIAPGDDTAINTPFAALLGAGRPDAHAAPQASEAPHGQRPAFPPRLVVSRSRKKRHGKTVTLVEGLGWPADALTLLARQLGAALGCGSSIDDGALVLQGDQRDRAKAWLQAEGARQVVCSG